MILIDTDQSVLIKPEHLGMKKQLFGGKKRCDSQEKNTTCLSLYCQTNVGYIINRKTSVLTPPRPEHLE